MYATLLEMNNLNFLELLLRQPNTTLLSDQYTSFCIGVSISFLNWLPTFAASAAAINSNRGIDIVDLIEFTRV